MVAKVDKALQAFGGGSPDPRVQATVARIRTKAAAKDVSAGTKALRRLRRRHKLKQGWARLRLPRWDSTDEDDVFALQAPATTPVAMKVKASPDPTPETPPFVPPFPGQTPSPNRKIVRRLVRRVVSASKDGVEVVGNRTRVKVVKNKVSPPFKQAEFDIMYGTGISREGSVLDLAVEEAIVKKSGAWYTYDGEQLGQGRENAKKYLTENPEVMVEISDRVWKAVMPDEEEATDVTDVDEDEEFSDADDMPIALDD